MSDEAYPIIVNPNPVSPKKPKILSVKLFLALTLVLIASTSSWYLIQNKPWAKKIIQEDPTTKEQSLQTHAGTWSAFLELDTSSNRAELKSDPDISYGDLFAPIVTQRPETKEGEWTFEAIVETKEGEVVYRSYRIMSIFPQEENPKKWDFGVTVPYIKEGIIRIFDLNNNQLFAGNL